jgi:hypothetical protein
VRRLPLVLVAVAAIVATALFAHAGAARDATRFRTPDAGAACRLDRAVLVCGSLASKGSLALRGRGAPTVVDALPWWDASTPVLKTFRHGSITCRLRGASIVCRNHGSAISVSGGGFAVAL